MATAYKPPQAEGKSAAEEIQRIHRIRITLTSKNVANLEKGAWAWAAGRLAAAAAAARFARGAMATALFYTRARA